MISAAELASLLGGVGDPSSLSPSAASRMGWLDLDALEAATGELDALVRLAAGRPVTWLGMGGSSMGAHLMAELAGSSRIHVVDSTHPAALDLPEDALVVVASKSGGTFEVEVALRVLEARGVTADALVALSDAGSELYERAASWALRLPTPAEVGGRFSALTHFGLAAAALVGLDVGAVLAGAREGDLEASVQRGYDAASEPGHPLLSMAGLGGGFADLWLEQLIAESSGKAGRGYVPLIGRGSWRSSSAHPAGGERELGRFLQESMACCVAMCAAIGVDPFDQPDVDATKAITAELLAGAPLPELGRVALGGLGAELDGVAYVALDAYLDPRRWDEVRELASSLEASCGVPVVPGMAPRMLHSTGQLHKGGPEAVLTVQLVEDGGVDLEVPGRPYSMRMVLEAQAAGDAAALIAKGRRVLRAAAAA